MSEFTTDDLDLLRKGNMIFFAEEKPNFLWVSLGEIVYDPSDLFRTGEPIQAIFYQEFRNNPKWELIAEYLAKGGTTANQLSAISELTDIPIWLITETGGVDDLPVVEKYPKYGAATAHALCLYKIGETFFILKDVTPLVVSTHTAESLGISFLDEKENSVEAFSRMLKTLLEKQKAFAIQLCLTMQTRLGVSLPFSSWRIGFYKRSLVLDLMLIVLRREQ
jgi:hypothetical protein